MFGVPAERLPDIREPRAGFALEARGPAVLRLGKMSYGRTLDKIFMFNSRCRCYV